MTGTGSSEIFTGLVFSRLLFSFGFLIACPPPNPKPVPVLFLFPPEDFDLWCFSDPLDPTDLLLGLEGFTFCFKEVDEETG